MASIHANVRGCETEPVLDLLLGTAVKRSEREISSEAL